MFPRFVRRAAAAALGVGAGFLIAACYGAPYNTRRPPPPEETRQVASPAAGPEAAPPAKGGSNQDASGAGAPTQP